MSTARTNPAKLWPLAKVSAIVLILASSSIAGAAMVPDFHLEDVNATSSTYGDLVSPRAYLQHVSAWYFGHSTT